MLDPEVVSQAHHDARIYTQFYSHPSRSLEQLTDGKDLRRTLMQFISPHISLWLSMGFYLKRLGGALLFLTENHGFLYYRPTISRSLF